MAQAAVSAVRAASVAQAALVAQAAVSAVRAASVAQAALVAQAVVDLELVVALVDLVYEDWVQILAAAKISVG